MTENVRLAYDTNFIIYAERLNDRERADRALDIHQRVDAMRLVIPSQVLGELFYALSAKFKQDGLRRGGFAKNGRRTVSFRQQRPVILCRRLRWRQTTICRSGTH